MARGDSGTGGSAAWRSGSESTARGFLGAVGRHVEETGLKSSFRAVTSACPLSSPFRRRPAPARRRHSRQRVGRASLAPSARTWTGHRFVALSFRRAVPQVALPPSRPASPYHATLPPCVAPNPHIPPSPLALFPFPFPPAPTRSPSPLLLPPFPPPCLPDHVQQHWADHPPWHGHVGARPEEPCLPAPTTRLACPVWPRRSWPRGGRWRWRRGNGAPATPRWWPRVGRGPVGGGRRRRPRWHRVARAVGGRGGAGGNRRARGGAGGGGGGGGAGGRPP